MRFKFPDDGDSDKSEEAETPLKRPKPTISKVYDEDVEKQDEISKKSSTKKSEEKDNVSEENDEPDKNVKASLASSVIDSNEPLWVSIREIPFVLWQSLKIYVLLIAHYRTDRATIS